MSNPKRHYTYQNECPKNTVIFTHTVVRLSDLKHHKEINNSALLSPFHPQVKSGL